MVFWPLVIVTKAELKIKWGFSVSSLSHGYWAISKWRINHQTVLRSGLLIKRSPGLPQDMAQSMAEKKKCFNLPEKQVNFDIFNHALYGLSSDNYLHHRNGQKKAMEEAVNISQSLSGYVIKAAAGMSVFTRRSNVKCSPMDYIYPELCTDE